MILIILHAYTNRVRERNRFERQIFDLGVNDFLEMGEGTIPI